ncbi:MAG TPA: TIGR03000 domain-containing protein [Gemmataceae bacterium]
MYSVVLMAALTTGGTAPDCGWLRACCHASYSCAGCRGCTGCAGCTGCYGGGCWGNCYGGFYSGCYGSTYSCYGCYGCQGCYGCYGCVGSTYIAPSVMPPAGGTDTKEKTDKETARPSKAKLVVELPADSKLYIDDQLMKSSTSVRSFSTPELELGQAYYYILRVEVARDGKTYQETKSVVIRAGEQIRASFTDLEPVATVAVKNDSKR